MQIKIAMNGNHLDTYMEKGQYEKAYKFMQKHSPSSHAERRKFIRYLEQMEHLVDAKKLVKEGLHATKLTKEDEVHYQILYAFTLMRQGESTQSEQMLYELQRYFTEEPNTNNQKCLYGHYYNLAGILAYNKGDYSTAEKHYQKALEYRNATNNITDIVSTLNNLGIIHEEYGNFQQAEKYFREVITQAKINTDKYHLAVGNNNLGRLYSKNRDYAQAKYHLMEAVTIYSALNRKLGAAEVLFDLTLIAQHQKNKEEVNKLARLLKQYAEDTQHPGIMLRSNIIHAIQLYQEQRYASRVAAQKILKNIARQQYYEFHIHAYGLLKLIDYLLEEYIDCTNTEIIDEIEEYITILESNIEMNNHLNMFADLYLLKSKLYLLKNDYTNAKKMYNKGLAVSLNKYTINKYGIYGTLLNQTEKLEVEKKTLSKTLILQLSKDMHFSIDQILNKYIFNQIEEYSQNKNLQKAFHEELNKENTFPLVVYKVSVNGVNIVYQDFEKFPETLEEDDFSFLFQLGISISVIIGQGNVYNTGVYDIPAGNSKKYRIFLYTFRIKDTERTDTRLDLGYFFLCIFVPEIIYSALPAIIAIKPLFQNFISKFTTYQQITDEDFQRLKDQFIAQITEWSK